MKELESLGEIDEGIGIGEPEFPYPKLKDRLNILCKLLLKILILILSKVVQYFFSNLRCCLLQIDQGNWNCWERSIEDLESVDQSSHIRN
jgi:hypothetical protein